MSDYCMCHLQRYWEELTSLSQESFDRQDYANALAYSKEALYRAEVLTSHLEGCLRLHIPFVRIYTESCCNLALLYKQFGETNQARALLRQAITHLIQLSQQRSLPNEVLETQLQRLCHVLSEK